MPPPRPGGSNRSRLAFCSWFYRQNPITEIPWTIDIQVRNVESLGLETWKNNPEIHSFIQHLRTESYSWIGSIWQLNSIRDERWNYSNYSTCKPSKLLTVRGCRKYDIMTCRSIQRFCGAHHTPGLGALVANPVVFEIDVLDGRVCLQRLGQVLEAATDQGFQSKGSVNRNLAIAF